MEDTRIFVVPFVSILLFTIYHFSYLYQHSSPSQAYDNVDEVITLNPTELNQDSDTSTVLNDYKQLSRPVVFDEKDVVVLSEKNFSHFILKNRYVVVVFYAPWCYWCKQLAPRYAAAATMLKAEGSQAVLAKVDCTVEKELVRKYHIQLYPSLYLFVGGALVDRNYGDRSRDAIATWVKSNMIPGIYTITTTEMAESILASGTMIVLGFLDTLEGPESKELAAASKLETDVNFYQTSCANVAKIFHLSPCVKRPALVVLKNEAEIYSQFDGQFTKSAIANFVSVNKLPLVITFNFENAPLIFMNPLKQLWLFAYANDSEIMLTFQEAAKAFKGKLLFVYVETLKSGISRDNPYVVAYTGYAQARKCVLDDELTLRSIKSYGENFLEDKLLDQLEPVPKDIW